MSKDKLKTKRSKNAQRSFSQDDSRQCVVCRGSSTKDSTDLPCRHVLCQTCSEDHLGPVGNIDVSFRCPRCKPKQAGAESGTRGPDRRNVTLQDPAVIQSERCSKHMDAITYFCQECEVAVCAHCCLEQHKDHAHQSLSNFVDTQKARLDHKLDECEGELVIRSAQLESINLRATEDISLAKQEVRATARKICELVARQEETLQKALDQVNLQCDRQLQQAKRSTQVQQDELNKIRLSLDGYANRPALFFSEYGKLETQMDNLYEKTQHVVKWDFELEESQPTLNPPSMVGEVHWDMTSEAVSNADVLVNAPLTGTLGFVTKPVLKQLCTFKVSTPSPEHHISGLTVIGSTIFIVCHGTSVQAYSNSGKHLKDIPIADAEDIWCMEKISERSLVIAEERIMTVLSLDEDDLTLEPAARRELPHAPSDITLASTGETVVTYRDNKTMQVFSRNFQTAENIQLPWKQARRPHCVVKTRRGYVVADENNTIAITDLSGTKYISLHGGPETLPEHQLNEPQHVIEDPIGRLLVCDSANDRVQVLSPDGTFLSHLLTQKDGIEYPSRLFLDTNTNRLYVGQRGVVSVFAYTAYATDHLKMTLVLHH